jgi:hypothetical protein
VVVGTGAADAAAEGVGRGVGAGAVSLNVTSAVTMTATAHSSATPSTMAVFLAPALTSGGADSSGCGSASSWTLSPVAAALPDSAAPLGFSPR